MQSELRERVQYLLAEYPVWTRRTLAEHFDLVVAKYPGRIFLYTPGHHYTYAWIHRQAELFARGLLALGIRPREHVAVIMGNYAEFLITKLALAKIGAVAVPLNTMLLEREISFLLEDSDAVAVVFNDRLGRQDFVKIMLDICPEASAPGNVADGCLRCSRLPKMRHLICFSPAGQRYPGLLDFAEVYRRGEAVPEESLRQRQTATAFPDDVVEIMYTSGSTALPKGALLSHDMLLRGTFASCLTKAVPNGWRVYTPLPFYHIFAWEQAVLAATFAGGAVITHAQFTPGEALELIQKYQAEELHSVPSLLLAVLNHPELSKYDLRSLRAVLCGAAVAPLPLWQRVKEELAVKELYSGYGMTEVCGAGTIIEAGECPELLAQNKVGRGLAPNCSGLPELGGRNIIYKVIDVDTGEELPPGKEGELVCRGNIVCRGYYKRPRENGELLDKDGWLRTGDLGIITPDGMIQFTGRSKEIYKTSGENVMPREIEDIISTHPKVNQVYVVGVPHEIMGEVGAVFIELKPGGETTRREIINFCKDKLARFKIPRYVFFVSAQELPFTATGKIQKFKLVEYAQQLLKERQLESVEV